MDFLNRRMFDHHEKSTKVCYKILKLFVGTAGVPYQLTFIEAELL